MSKSIKVLNLLNDGNVGGIETLCLEAAEYIKYDTTYLILWKGGKISEEMISRGYKVKILDTSVARYLEDSIKIAKMCKKEKFDVVLCNGTNPFTALCTIMIHRLCKRTRIIGYVHSAPDDWNKKTHISAKIIFKYAKKVICISDFVLNSTKKYIGYEDKLVRIYNGVNTSKFSSITYVSDVNKFADEICNSKKTINLIYVGRLEKVKGVQNILNSLSELKNILYKFRIVGDGSYRRDLERLTNELGITNKVEFLGIRRDIPELLHKSDVFVHLPDWQEGFGITVIEAMASGLICIVNNHGALPEIVQDDINGYVVSENGHKFTEILQKIADGLGSDEIEKIRYRAIAKAEYFSIQAYAEKLEKVIREIL